MLRRLKQSGGVATNLVILAIVLVTLTALWQRSADKQRAESEIRRDINYVSLLGEFELTIPKDWSLGPNSGEEDGVVFLEILGPRNDVVNKAFAEDGPAESETIEEALENQRYSELIQTSVGREYALLQVEVVTSTSYEIPTTKEPWRTDLEASETTASGVAYGEFIDFSVPGAKGYRYSVTIFEGEHELKATSYYLLGDQAEAEILLFPADSSFAKQAEDIVRSFIFTTNEEAEQAADAL